MCTLIRLQSVVKNMIQVCLKLVITCHTQMVHHISFQNVSVVFIFSKKFVKRAFIPHLEIGEDQMYIWKSRVTVFACQSS